MTELEKYLVQLINEGKRNWTRNKDRPCPAGLESEEFLSVRVPNKMITCCSLEMPVGDESPFVCAELAVIFDGLYPTSTVWVYRSGSIFHSGGCGKKIGQILGKE